MKKIILFKSAFLLLCSLTVNAQSHTEINHSSSSTSAQLDLIEEGENNFTRLFMSNAQVDRDFKLNARFNTEGVQDDNFRLNYYDGSTTETLLLFDADVDSTTSYNTFTIEQPSTDAMPNLRLHQTADDYAFLTFSNGGFANNRWIVRGDPSGTAGEAPFDILWKNVVSGTTTNFIRLDAGDSESIRLNQNTEVTAELTVTQNTDLQADLNVDAGVAYLDKLVVGNDVLPAGLSFVSNDDLYINNSNGDVYFRDNGVNEARVGYDDDNTGGNSGELIIENNQVAGSIDFRIGNGINDFSMTDGLMNCSADIKPSLHKTYDLGVSGTAWDNIYCDDLIEQGAAAFTDRVVTDEILNYPPIAKKEGMFDYKNERGLEELDPAMLPSALQESNGILIDEMATYNYKANYEQQLQIKNLEAQVKELQSIIKDLLDK